MRRLRPVAINEWWIDDSSQKFWMEITDRGDIGGALLAPQVADHAKPKWGHELVRFVRADDVVLHWFASHRQRAPIAYSRVARPPSTTTMVHRSRGTAGQAYPSPLAEGCQDPSMMRTIEPVDLPALGTGLRVMTRN